MDGSINEVESARFTLNFLDVDYL